VQCTFEPARAKSWINSTKKYKTNYQSTFSNLYFKSNQIPLSHFFLLSEILSADRQVRTFLEHFTKNVRRTSGWLIPILPRET
jgi:hypothetical protein